MDKQIISSLESGFDSRAHVAYPFQRKALKRFEQLGLPTKNNEAWKYTRLEKFWQDFSTSETKNFEAAIPNDYLQEAAHFHFCNGELKGHATGLEERGISIEKIDKNNLEKFSQLKEQLEELTQDEALYQLLEAASEEHYLIQLSKNCDSMLFIDHLYSGNSHKFCHLHILAQEGSRAGLIERHTCAKLDEESFVHHATSVVVSDTANLDHVKLQELNTRSCMIDHGVAKIGRDANYSSITLDLGAKMSRKNIKCELSQAGAHASVHGVYRLKGDQHADINSTIWHKSAHTTSDQLYKGALDDRSHGIFSGIIRVEKDAQLIRAEQLNKNLLLGEKAHAHSRPQLEIFADDVKCSHGSTTGRLSEDEIFYFESRAVDRAKAIALLGQAFATDVAMKIRNEKMRVWVLNALQKGTRHA